MTQKGEHTWDLYVDYHRCPACGFINENRLEFHRNKDVLSQDIVCGRCGQSFTVQKVSKRGFGPLFGSPQPPEITWDSEIS